MKRTLVIAAMVLLAGAFADAQVCTMVSVGSTDVDFPPGEGQPPNNDANLSLIAYERCDGTVGGQLQDTLAGGVAIHAKVVCLYVSGNDAWITAVITHANPHPVFGDDYDGVPINIRVRDNGKFTGDPPDQASFWDFADSYGDCYNQFQYTLFDLGRGQVQIKER